MDFTEVCDVFGGSIFPEEYRGDYAQARQHIDALQSDIDGKSDDEKQTMVKLLGAILWMFQGRHVEAEQSFADILDCSRQGKVGIRWLFRSSTYTILNTVFQHHPPLFRSSPLLHGLSTRLDENIREYDQFVETLISIAYTIRDQVEPLDAFECDVIVFIYVVSGKIARSSWTLDETGAVKRPPIPQANIEHFGCEIDGISITPGRLKQTAADLGLKWIARYIDRLCLEVNRCRESPQLAGDVVHLLQQYNNNQDALGVASMHLMIGDNIVSGPTTSPICLNFTLMEQLYHNLRTQISRTQRRALFSPGFPGGISDPDDFPPIVASVKEFLSSSFNIEPLLLGESAPSLVDVDRIHSALTHYAAAALIYERIEAPRGLMALSLRLACVMKMRTLDPILVWHEPKDSLRYSTPATLISGWQTLFEKHEDALQNHIYGVHFRFQGNSKEDDHLKQLGVWGFRNGSEPFVERLGLIQHHAGHWWRYMCGRAENAGSYYEKARRIFYHVPSLKVCWFSTLDSIADTLASVGRYTDANIYIETMREGAARILDRLTQAQSDPHADNMDMWKDALRSAILNRLVRHFVMVYPMIGRLDECVSTLVRDTLEQLCSTITAIRHYGVQLDHLKELVEFLIMNAQVQENRTDFLAKRKRIVELSISDSRDIETSSEYSLMLEVRKLSVLLEADEEIHARTLALKIIANLQTERLRILSQSVAASRVMEISSAGEGYDLRHDHGEGYKDLNDDNELVLLPDHLIDEAMPSACLKTTLISESMLKISIAAKLWGIALCLDADIERLSPGYFTSVHAGSASWPWQRRLWRGLLQEHKGFLVQAFHSYFQALYISMRSRGRYVSFEEERDLYQNSDLGRLQNCLARILLHLHKHKFALPERDQVSLHSAEWSWVRPTFTDHFPSHFGEAAAIEMLELSKAQYVLSRLVLDHESEKNRSVDRAQWLDMADKHFRWKQLRSLGSNRSQEEEAEFADLNVDKGRPAEYYLHAAMEFQTEVSHEAALLRAKGFGSMQAAIPANATVVYTALSEDGLALFALHREGVKFSSWNASLTRHKLRKSVQDYLRLMNTDKDAADIFELNRISSEIADAVIHPVYPIIEQKPEIIFVAAGDLAHFPLAALYLGDSEYLGTWKALSQTPSLAYWCHWRMDRPLADDSTAMRVAVIAKPGSLVEEARGGEKCLPMGGIEAMYAASCVNNSVLLNAASVTRRRFCQELASCQIMHVCTHGIVDSSRPMGSCISLKERLRVMDLVGVRSSAKFVILSACFSGNGISQSTDDVIGFSHAILGTGVQMFAGCLWAVNELSTLILLVVFYLALAFTAKQEDGASFVTLWHHCLEVMRGLDSEQAEELLDYLIDLWPHFENRGFQPNEFVRGGRSRLIAEKRRLAKMRSDPSCPALDFGHPFYWAPFTLIGFSGYGVKCHLTDTLGVPQTQPPCSPP
jgi:CHAT domain-containing protein